MTSVNLIKPYFAENRWIIALGLLCLIAVDFFQLFIPRIIKWAVDDITTLDVDGRTLLVYALEIVALALLIAAFRYVWRRCLIGLSREVEEGLRNRLFDHVQGLDAGYFDRVKSGDLMAHASNDLHHIRMATGMGMVALTDSIVLGTAAIGFMAYIDLRLTLLVLIPMPLIIFSTRFFGRRMHRHYQEVQAAFADLTEVVRERLAGIRIIKAYNLEGTTVEKLEGNSRDYVGKNLRLTRITGSFFPMMVFYSNLSLTIILYIGGRQTIFATITPGDFVAFISYLGLLTWPMMAMGWLTNLIQRGKASLDRIDVILKTRPRITSDETARPVRKPEGEIAFHGVRFHYGEGENRRGEVPVLDGIDLEISKGGTLGIVGPPGGGKTTLLNLIPRLYDVSRGAVTLDGVDIRSLRLEDLRGQIAFVPQEPFLFAGTIRENITFGLSVAEERLTAAVRGAALEKTIQDFRKGYETLVGEKGVILSGGQKQRIGLARALLRDAPILILDDPISQVDTETGNRIVGALREAARERTTLIVSHRLSALRFADTIITLAEGRVVESGGHDALLAADGYYARTFRMQELEEEMNES